MALAIVCPGCDADYSVPENLIGKAIRCKKCGETIDVKARPKAKARVTRDDDDDYDRPRKAVRRRDEDDDDYEDSPKKKGTSPVLIALAAILLLGGAAAGSYFAFGGGTDEPQPIAQNTDKDKPRTRTEDTTQPKDEPKTPAKKETVPAEKAPAPAPAKTETAKADTPKTPEKTPEVAKAETPKDTPKASDTATVDSQIPGKITGKGGTQTGISYDRYVAGIMDPITLQTVKNAAVYIFCESGGGAGTGSGWFGIEPGIVFTNAHVLHMKAPNTPKPKKLEIYLNSGMPNQRKIPHSKIKILAVDRNIDLAVLQIMNEKDLPPPLKVRASSECFEGLRLSTAGFPFGADPSQISGRASHEPEVSIRPTAVTSFRRNDYGQLRRVQLEGGANPGNSGGAVVDAEGSVCTVIVEGVHGGGGPSSGIALTMGVPTEYCFGILAGRIAETKLELAYKDGDKVHIPIKIECLDPMERLKSVGVAAWIGNDSKKYRSPGAKKPDSEPGDRDYVEIPLKYDSKKKVATGEIVLPKKPDGTVYWVQPFYSSPIVDRYWEPGLKYEHKGEAGDRVEANLVYKPSFGKSRTVTMSQAFAASEAAEGEGASRADTRQRKYGLTVNEQVLPPDGSDSVQAAKLRLSFLKLLMPKVVSGNSEDDMLRVKDFERINAEVKKSGAGALVNKAGEIYKYVINTTNIPGAVERHYTGLFTNSAVEALKATSFELPNKVMKPGETWTSTKDQIISFQDPPPTDAQGRPIPNVKPAPVRTYHYAENLTLKYIGTRTREGRKEAMIEIDGKIAQAKGMSYTASGVVTGYAMIELDTGIIIDTHIDKEFEVDTSVKGIKKAASGFYTYDVKRSAAN